MWGQQAGQAGQVRRGWPHKHQKPSGPKKKEIQAGPNEKERPKPGDSFG